MTSFSSRGPNSVAEDIIKPDVTAPGMQILAGASPYADPGGKLFQSIAGTSMSSPHVAGLFALLKQAHPDWTAAMAKSALMTTAYQDVQGQRPGEHGGPVRHGCRSREPGIAGQAGIVVQPRAGVRRRVPRVPRVPVRQGPEVFANPAARADSSTPSVFRRWPRT
jgi:hypothetical protein